MQPNYKAGVAWIAEHDSALAGPCLTCISKLAAVDLLATLFGRDPTKVAMEVACFRINKLGAQSCCIEPEHERLSQC